MELCDKYLYELLKINPVLNDFFLDERLLNKKHIQPNIYSEEFYQKLHELDKKYLKLLEKKKVRTLYDDILLRDIKNNIRMELDYEIYMYMPINYNDNILIDYVTDCRGDGNYIFSSRKDYSDFLKRLTSLSSITKEILLKMEDGIRNKVCLSKSTVDKMIENIQDILKHKSYNHKLKNKLKPKEWDETVTKYLVNNLDKLSSFLTKEYYPHTIEGIGLQSYKGGKDAYRTILKNYTFKSITPQQVHDLGWRELKRLTKEKKKLERMLNIKNIDEYVKKYTYTNGDDIIRDLKKIRKTLQTKIYPKYFHGKIENKDLYDIQKVQLENKQMFAYYNPPDLKGNKKGTFYMNTSIPKNINKHELYVLSLHEGIPGHHFEITTNNKKNIPNYLKLGDTTYSEGWGLYCENLGDYQYDLKYYFKLQYEIQRSVRLIIDTAIHFFGWDYSKCFQFMKKYLHFEDDQIHNEILRYMDDPGQAITYKIGEKAFLFIREKLLKEGSTIQDIHQKMLAIGPCPIEFLINNF